MTLRTGGVTPFLPLDWASALLRSPPRAASSRSYAGGYGPVGPGPIGRAAREWLFGPFCAPYSGQILARTVARTLFGQSLQALG
jgi:hypothetical protein